MSVSGTPNAPIRHLLDKRRPPWGLKWRSHTAFILATVGVGIFTDLFLYGIIVPILPFMLRDRMEVPPEDIQSRIDYLLATYASGSVLFSPISGYLADKMPSRQLPFLVGLVALFVATFLFAIGETLWVAYIARLLQGVSAAVVWTVGMAMVLETVGAQHLGKSIGTMFSFITPGAILAPTIGGAIYSRAGYVAVFMVGGSVLVVDFIMRLFLIEKPVARRYMQVEDEIVEDSTTGESANTNGHAEAGATEDSPLLKADDSLVYKIPPGQPERVRNFPFLYCLSDVSLLASMFAALVHAILIGSFDATLPKYGEELFGFDSLQAGLLFIPLGVIDSLITPFTGWLVDRFGPKHVGTPGFVFTAPLMFAFRFVTANTHDQLVLYCVLLALTGIGISVIGTPSLVEAGAVVQRYYDANPAFFDHHPPYATLYGLQSMVFMLGLTIGPLVAGGLKDWIGYGNMNAVMAVVAILSAVVCWQFLGRRPRPKPIGGDEE